MKPGEKLDQYTLLHEIGKGAFGLVFLAQKDDGKYVALKVVSLLGEMGDRELQALESYKKCPPNESLIEIYDHVIQENQFYYTMELADNILGNNSQDYVPATLSEVLRREKKLNVLQTTELITQLLEGLSIIHANKLVHRDIKPANIVWVNGRAKLSDIGLMANNLSLTYRAGSDGFLPTKESCIPENSTTIDLYALTRVIYCCLSGKNVEHYPDIDWNETKNFQGGELLNLMLASDEDLVKMDALSIRRQLLSESISGSVCVNASISMFDWSWVGARSYSREVSKKTYKSRSSQPSLTESYSREVSEKTYDSLSSLPSLTKLASAESWIRKQKLTKKDFLSAAAAGTIIGAAAPFLPAGIPLAALVGSGIFLSKLLRKK